MHRSVLSSKIYRMSAYRVSRKGDSLIYENETVNFVLAINSEGEHSFIQLHRLLKIHVSLHEKSILREFTNIRKYSVYKWNCMHYPFAILFS